MMSAIRCEKKIYIYNGIDIGQLSCKTLAYQKSAKKNPISCIPYCADLVMLLKSV